MRRQKTPQNYLQLLPPRSQVHGADRSATIRARTSETTYSRRPQGRQPHCPDPRPPPPQPHSFSPCPRAPPARAPTLSPSPTDAAAVPCRCTAATQRNDGHVCPAAAAGHPYPSGTPRWAHTVRLDLRPDLISTVAQPATMAMPPSRAQSTPSEFTKGAKARGPRQHSRTFVLKRPPQAQGFCCRVTFLLNCMDNNKRHTAIYI